MREIKITSRQIKSEIVKIRASITREDIFELSSMNSVDFEKDLSRILRQEIVVKRRKNSINKIFKLTKTSDEISI